MLISILSVIAVLAAGPAAPAEAPPSSELKRPVYTRLPTLDDLVHYYPPGAMSSGWEGTAVLRCTAALSGRLEDCVVESETAPGHGFGEAALGIATLIELSPAEHDGKPVAISIRVPIGFKLPTDTPPGWEQTVRCHGLLSAHARVAPDDRRMAGGVTASAARAVALGAARGLSEAQVRTALDQAAATTPPPTHPGATRDRCFTAFL